MKNVLKLVIIGLTMVLMYSCVCGTPKKSVSVETNNVTPTNSITVEMLRTSGVIETETFEIPNDMFITIQKTGDKSWLVYKCENCMPTILKNRVTHVLNTTYKEK